MPAAYLISESQVTDQALMDEYAKKAGPSVAAHDGELVADHGLASAARQ